MASWYRYKDTKRPFFLTRYCYEIYTLEEIAPIGHTFPIFKLPNFLLPVLNLGGQFLAVFLGFVIGIAPFCLLGIEKGQSITRLPL